VIKDIDRPKVDDIAIAAVPDTNEETGADEWNIYLINMKEVTIDNVLISSRGYGKAKGEEVKTSELRHFVESLPAHSYVKIEPIMEELFSLNNQYWLSFYIGDKIFDKKYVFLPETIQKSNLTEIPLMGRKGVMIK
jgi:hypothetical protein